MRQLQRVTGLGHWSSGSSQPLSFWYLTRTQLPEQPAILTSSSGSYASLAERARFDLGVAPLPYYDDFSAAPQNTLVRGSALWVMDGRPKREYPGVAAFLAFLAAPEVQAQWQQKTGSAPTLT